MRGCQTLLWKYNSEYLVSVVSDLFKWDQSEVEMSVPAYGYSLRLKRWRCGQRAVKYSEEMTNHYDVKMSECHSSFEILIISTYS